MNPDTIRNTDLSVSQLCKLPAKADSIYQRKLCDIKLWKLQFLKIRMANILPFSLSTYFFHPCRCIHNPWRADNEICSHDVYNFVTKKYTYTVIKKIHRWAMVICLQYWSRILAATNIKITEKWPQLWCKHVCAHKHTYIWTRLSWLQPLFTLVHTKVMLTITYTQIYYTVKSEF